MIRHTLALATRFACAIAASFILPVCILADEGKPKEEFKPYTETIPETKLKFNLVPIAGGKFVMGSPADEADRVEDEGPQIEVEISPFWMATHEVTWDQFDVFAFSYDVKAAKRAVEQGTPLQRSKLDLLADAVTRPTPPYVDMTFGYGHDNYPAICMTQHAAAQYCKWLAEKTGKKYRLPTEAEFEYAARAGAKDAYFFGADPAKLGDYAWYYDNSNEKPQPVGKKKPNPWGLYDILGNVSEWCSDKYAEDYFTKVAEGKEPPIKNPLFVTDETVWHAARGGSWQDDASFLRCATRRGANEDWSIQDPQDPKSIWWHTDAHFVGLRVVRSFE